MLKVLEVSKIMSVKNIRNEHDKEIEELADSISVSHIKSYGNRQRSATD